MKKTFLELQDIDGVVGKLYQADPTLKDTKFGYAYTRFSSKNYEPAVKKFNEDMQDLAVKHALDDTTTKALLKDDRGQYQYSKEGQIAMQKEQRALLVLKNTELIEVEPYLSPLSPEMTIEQFEILKDVLVNTHVPVSEKPKKK